MSATTIVRDPRISVLMPDAGLPSTVSRPRGASYGKQIERRIVRAWKFVTRTTRRQPRNSFISPDFVVLTSRRRSTMILPQYRYQQ